MTAYQQSFLKAIKHKKEASMTSSDELSPQEKTKKDRRRAAEPLKEKQTVRFHADTLTDLEEIANTTNMSIANVVRLACEDYIEKRHIHDELSSLEERLSASFNRAIKETNKVGNDVQLLIALVDQIARFLFSVTPEIIDKSAAQAVGSVRYNAFISEIHNSFNTKNNQSILSENLREED